MSNSHLKPAKQRISERIKAGKIQQKLQRHVLADASLDEEGNHKQEYKEAFMTVSQVNAGFRLLSKVVPDLKQVEHTGDVTHRVDKVSIEIVEPKTSNS